MNQKSSSHRLSSVTHDAELRVVAEGVEYRAEQRTAVDRRAQVAHVATEDRVKMVETIAPAPVDVETLALPLLDLIANLRLQGGSQLRGGGRQSKPHMHFAGQLACKRLVRIAHLMP